MLEIIGVVVIGFVIVSFVQAFQQMVEDVTEIRKSCSRIEKVLETYEDEA